MKKVMVMTLVVGLVSVSAFGSIQTTNDMVYGNTVTLNGGSQYIWSAGQSEDTFKSTLYAIDAQSAGEYMTWNPDNSDGRDLNLTWNNNWVDGAITHKFVAPAGQQFSGGTVSFIGGGIWGGAQFNMTASSNYGNDGYGNLTNLGTIYSSDTRWQGPEWAMNTWTVNIPANVSEFYVSVQSTVDYSWTWGNSLYASNVTFTPEPATIGMVVLGGIGLLRRKNI